MMASLQTMMKIKFNTSRRFLFMWLVTVLLYQARNVGSSDCVHGIGLPDGTCDCYSCWKGNSCDEYASRPPRFTNDFASVTLTNLHLEGQPVYKAEAIDPDEEFCRDPSGCACSNITYFIVSQDGDSNFLIDKYTGEIKVSGESYSLFPTYELKIGANDDGVTYDIMTLTITTGTSWDETDINRYRMGFRDGYSSQDTNNFLNMAPEQGEKPHHRQKRAISLPSNVTFTLFKNGINQNITEIKVGHRIQFQLDIIFPSGKTDMQVEIFTPDSDSIVMMLCNVVVIKGSNLAINGTLNPVLESLTNSTYNDRAIIALGTVNNSGADQSTYTNSTITVKYEAVMVENPSTLHNKEYWVSVGAEFNNENDVWVGQASFITNTTNDSSAFTALTSAQPQANVSGPSSMSIGSSALFTLDLAIMYPVMDIKMDVFAPINYTDVMSICDAKVVNVSEAYSCGFKDLSTFTPTFSAEGNTVGYKRMTMYLGRPVNKLAREYSVNATYANRGIISFVIQITLMDDVTLVGNDYWIGATVEIGTTAIWAGQIKVSAVARTLSQVTSPTLNMYLKNGTSVSSTKPGIIQVDMTIPENTYADYLLEVVGPFQSGESVFQMCGVNLSFGENVACGCFNKIVPEYRITSNTSSYADIIRVNLGRITNIGSYGWNSTKSQPKNIISIKIYFKVANSSLVTVGNNYTVSIGVFLGSTNLTIGQISVPISSPVPVDNITALNTPQRSLSIGGRGSEYIPIGRAGKILLTIQTARNTIYSPFKIEAIMPNTTNTRPQAKICKIQLQSVGQNNPCVVKESLEKSAQLLSSFNDNNYDRAVVNMDSLCNIEMVNDTLQDQIVLAINFILLNDTQFYSDNKTLISAGIMYTPLNLWVAQIAIYANLSSSAYSLSTPPYITSVENNLNLNVVPLGFPAKFYIRIKIAPNNTTPLALNISTLDDALSICDIRLSRMGDGYPCLDSKSSVKKLFPTDEVVGVNRQGYIDLGIVDNVGPDKLVSTPSFDSNTIEIELVTKVTPDVAKAASGSVHSLKVTLKYGTNYAQSMNLTVNVTVTSNTSLVDAYTLASASLTGNVSALSITGRDDPVAGEKLNTIVKSESKRIAVSIDTVLNSTSQLSVTFSTPMNSTDVMEILYIGLLDTGENLPCLTQTHTIRTYQPRNVGGLHVDIAEIKLGYVCNIGSITNSTTANRLRVESLVRLLDSATVSVGDNLYVTVTVNSNNQSILVYTFPLTVGDATNYTDIYLGNLTITNGTYLNSTEDPIFVAISSLKTIPLVFTVPPYTSSEITFDAIMPVNTSAIMTVSDVQFIKSGKNLPNLASAQNNFKVTTFSKYNTSQVTKYEMSMGVISNGGMTYRHGLNAPDDDIFTVEVTFQMADNPIATNGSVHKVSFGINVANVVYILDVLITVKRTGKETLLFNATSLLNTTTSYSSRVDIETTIALSNLSTAEAQNAVLNIFLPPYVLHMDTVILNNDKWIVNITKYADNTISVYLGTVFFTDEVYLITTLEPNATYLVPLGISGLNTVFGYQLVGDTNALSDVPGDMDYVNFTITTTPDSGIACDTGPLGLETGGIKNCQLSSSEDSLLGHEVDKGRYNSLAGWSPFVHAGKVSEERYFQVYFGNKTMVTKILLKQNLTAAKLKTLKLRYSNDGWAWIEESNNVISPNPLNTTQELIVPVPQVSRYIRLMVYELDDNKKIGYFSFELIGCRISNDKPADVCSDVTTPLTKLADFSRRSFIKGGGNLYVCDSVQGKKGIVQKCFLTKDDLTWIELDSRVGSMLGYEPSEQRIFAVSSNGLSYMSSLNGTDWFSSVPSDVTKAKALPYFKNAIKVPVDGNSNLDSTTPVLQYIDSIIYGATSDGVKKDSGSWQLIFSWNTITCCP